MKNLKQVIFLLIWGVSPTFAGNDTLPPVGSYGFDWLHPESAQCKQMTRKDIDKFKGCKYEKQGGSFGLDLPYYFCAVNEDIEYFVYLTKANCREAKETMEANAP